MKVKLKKGETVMSKAAIRQIAEIVFTMGKGVGKVIQCSKPVSIAAYKDKLSGISLDESRKRAYGTFHIPSLDDNPDFVPYTDLIISCIEAGYGSNSEQEARLKAENICEVFFEEQKTIALKDLQ